ncbi:DUF5691 domain-containing protein [Nocardioides nitrophenolicus]|uniref:DUF5691 domain-containing protein n=1 Tax=Nocardioides nitrophenolicus TaxID=60489 RepID=UPI0019580C76|nr:DUF5691 domain-containing protein [Nocardioides nitrophenolicus]MBM7516735.1 putative nucleic acid-binding Zn ribbon protein [Nocardioides nitrophenolicus]
MSASWWQQTTAAALLGTERREPPPLPPELGVAPRAGSTPETALLDAAAVGGALLRARLPACPAGELPEPAAPDAIPLAPPAAVQLLGLLVDQPPVAARLRPLALERWLQAAADRGVRVPARALPRLLALATQQSELRAATRPVIGERGRWLAGLRSDWTWAVAPEPAPVAATPIAPDDWHALPAAARADALPADDLDLLEAALDDRSDKVRRQALALLDAAPTSARAARMAARLRPLLASTGRLRRGLEITLPTAPDAAGVRDGLTTTRGGSQRERWLELIAAGAPLAVWTEVTGKDPAHTWPLITQPAARAGVLRAVRARGELAWAAAAVADSPDLLAVLPVDHQDATALHLLRTTKAPAAVAAVVRHVSPPWSPALSAAVVDLLRHTTPAGGSAAVALPSLAAGLHPSVRPAVSAWARAESRWGSLPADLDQYLSFLPAITEAFR